MRKFLSTLLCCTTSFVTALDVNSFGADLYSQAQKEKGNLLISPYSAFSALSLVSLGANGTTWDQMAKTLYWSGDKLGLAAANHTLFDSLSSDQTTLANSLWVQDNYPLTSEFLQLTTVSDVGDVFPLNFSTPDGATNEINTWVAEKTEQKIKELFKSGDIDPSTRVVIVNTLHFKAPWLSPFDTASTHNAPFYGAEELSVPTMSQSAHFPLYNNDQLALVELPYKSTDDAELAFYLILPNERNADLATLAAELHANWSTWTSGLTSTYIELQMPRFTFSTDLELNASLQAMGMIEPFTGHADFSNLDGTRDLLLSKVVQSSWISVDEAGTEAASATGATMNLKFVYKPDVQKIHADHPFLFLIADKASATWLFIGRLTKPESHT